MLVPVQVEITAVCRTLFGLFPTPVAEPLAYRTCCSGPLIRLQSSRACDGPSGTAHAKVDPQPQNL
ncbi:hypothetical protein Hanom_Chr10g00963491 [Helianthus anomalus]